MRDLNPLQFFRAPSSGAAELAGKPAEQGVAAQKAIPRNPSLLFDIEVRVPHDTMALTIESCPVKSNRGCDRCHIPYTYRKLLHRCAAGRGPDAEGPGGGHWGHAEAVAVLHTALVPH